jgi:phosphoglycerate kinase
LKAEKRALRTLDDIREPEAKVFLRLDVNLPLDPISWDILDHTRITKSLPTLRRLSNAALVLGSHQSRPLKSDFSSLEKHARILADELKREVKFVPDVLGPTARDAIDELEPGEILVLDNLRFCAEENYNAPPESLVRTHFVRKLAPLFDLYVNDAFAASHRTQPSLVGLPQVLEPFAGRLMEDEITALGRLFERMDKPRTLCLGGAKLETKLELLESMLRKDKVDEVLVSGLAGIAFVQAAGFKVGPSNERTVKGALAIAARIYRDQRDKIVLPADVAVKEDGERVECSLDEIGDRMILDVGSQTTGIFADRLRESRSIFANGPAGFFEFDDFRKGTDSLLLAIAMSPAPVKVLGGGHLGSLAAELGMSEELHISTGGGVILALLEGEELPAIELLKGEWSKPA